MGKDYGSWLHQPHSAWQSPNLNCTSPQLDPGLQNTFPAYVNPYYTRGISANGALPGFAVSELPQIVHSNEPYGWFHCLPSHHRQAITPNLDYVAKEKLSSAFPYRCNGVATPNVESGSVPKRYLVFDQSGNQTRLVFSSVVGPTFQHQISKAPRPFGTYGLHDEVAVTRRDSIYQFGPVMSEGLGENHESGGGSEMHEDTEEINALLYSDDDDVYGDDDEETSTGHSPSEMTGYEKQEEVASSAGPAKRRKLLNGEHELSSLMDTASSAKRTESWDHDDNDDDDAESSFVKGRTDGRYTGSSYRCPGRESIRETVSILQSIIPGGEGKDAVMVLDEAIHYLKSLKLKAKALRVSPSL